jgi:hypothetical protein
VLAAKLSEAGRRFAQDHTWEKAASDYEALYFVSLERLSCRT